LLIALPFVIVFGVPVAFTIWAYQESGLNYTHCIWKCLAAPFLFVLGIIINVILLPFAIVALPFVLIGLLINYCLNKRR